MREDPTVATVSKSILAPKLMAGMPNNYALMAGLLTALTTVFFRQVVFGPIFGGVLIMLGQFLTKLDPFMFNIIAKQIYHFGLKRRVVLH